MDEQEVELLIRICDMYRTICDMTGAECELNRTMIEDTLIRIRNGEYVVKRNPEW